uniref:RNase H type-1 domain-containing protein n=1 Tax=Chenopodium quinoa TaxID=63459 RepID=A0A803L309_CHEQI
MAQPIGKPSLDGYLPRGDWVALNTDGAAKASPGAARGGGVLRDCYENFIKAFLANFGVCYAELLALELGLHMAITKGISKLVVQMDNKACIEALQNEHLQGGEPLHQHLRKTSQLKGEELFVVGKGGDGV